MTTPRWRFVSNQNTEITGINDAGIETFSTAVLYSLVRESIQNSLDAQKKPICGPVHVEFSSFTISPEAFPDYAAFRAVLEKCLSSNKDEPQAVEFFRRALDVMNGPIHVLRVSDHNTIGLRGAQDGKKGSDWSRLVKEHGSSNKHDESGGSFGIGKSAAFACSQLRTVVYNSLDEEGVESHIGVARLISFEAEKDSWTTGTGYYSLDDKFLATLQNISFDPYYARRDSGTDIYIFGVSIDDATAKQIEEAVLINFFVSIHREKLVVTIGDKTISKSNLSAYVSKINPYDANPQLAAIVPYYQLIASANPSVVRIPLDSSLYGKKYGFEDGDCTLYLMEGDNLNRRVLMTRSAGMSLFEQDRFKSNIMFTGLLIIEGAKMNAVFKDMEVPSHDAWVPSRCKGREALYDRIYKELRAYLRKMVTDSFATEIGDEIEAFGAGEFLPDISQTTTNESSKKPAGLKERLQRIREKKQKKKQKVSRPVKLIPTDPNQVSVPQKEKKSSDKKAEPEKKSKKPSFKHYAVEPRAICTDASNGQFDVKMIVPEKAKQAQLFFSIAGEQRDVDANILSASIRSTSQVSIASFEKNCVILNDLHAGDSLHLDIAIDFDAYCRLEVQYYASKK